MTSVTSVRVSWRLTRKGSTFFDFTGRRSAWVISSRTRAAMAGPIKPYCCVRFAGSLRTVEAATFNLPMKQGGCLTVFGYSW